MAKAGLVCAIVFVSLISYELGCKRYGRETGMDTVQASSEVMSYLTQSRVGWTEGSSEPEKFIPSGNRVVVFVHARFRPKGSTEWQEVRLADVYTSRDGRPIQMRAFADRQEALRWVGVGDSSH